MAPDPRTTPDNLAEIDHLARTLAKDPRSKAFLPLAEEYGKAGMWQEAASVLEEGLKVYPGFVTAMVALGRAYHQLNQPDKAKAVLEDAVKSSPENLRAHRTLAGIYIAQGAIEAARKSCAVLLAANPKDQEALALRTALDAAQASATAPPTTVVAPVVESAPDNPAVESVSSPAPSKTAEPASLRQTASIVDRLEGWLASIRSRRQDRPDSGPPDKPTL